MKSSERGLTLLEVLLALLIGGLVLSSVYGVFASVSGVHERLEKESIEFHKMRIFFDRLGGELSSLNLRRIGQEAVLSAGNNADEESFLEFNTALSSPFMDRYGGVSRVRYEARPGADGIAIYRSEKPLLADLAAEEPLLYVDRIRAYDIRYYGQGNWRDDWSAQSLPQLIEVFIELDIDGRAVPFRSSFMVSGMVQ